MTQNYQSNNPSPGYPTPDQRTTPTPPDRAVPLHWPLILGLGALALVRPLVNVIQSQLDVTDPPLVPVLITVAISVAWIAVVGFSHIPRPVLTLVLAGVAYAVFSMVLSGILSPLLTGRLQGPLQSPYAVMMVLATNAFWGLLAGLLARGIQRIRT